MKISVKSIFVSDVHIGCKYCKADKFYQFLDSYTCENLYLVGDIIDGWRLQKKFYWIDEYWFIIRKIIGMIKKNHTNVFWILGNHDEAMRKMAPIEFGGIKIVNEVIYETNGKKYLILHGDIFDGFLKKVGWMYGIGDKAYQIALWTSELLTKIRLMFGLSYWSLSAYLKSKVKNAINFVNNYEKLVVQHAKQHNCHGIVCGHIHQPAIKMIDDIEYLNCGDFIEHCTAIIEHHDGKIELIKA